MPSKLVDTKDLKNGNSQFQSIAVQGSLKHPIKSYNFNLAFSINIKEYLN